MKKRGFTLAEVLIALGVVGVIAAITTPMLMTATAKSQVETGLAKSVAIWEQANIGALKDADSSNILDAWGKSDGTLNYEEYSKALSNQMKMSSKLIEENQETSFVNKLLPSACAAAGGSGSSTNCNTTSCVQKYCPNGFKTCSPQNQLALTKCIEDLCYNAQMVTPGDVDLDVDLIYDESFQGDDETGDDETDNKKALECLNSCIAQGKRSFNFDVVSCTNKCMNSSEDDDIGHEVTPGTGSSTGSVSETSNGITLPDWTNMFNQKNQVLVANNGITFAFVESQKDLTTSKTPSKQRIGFVAVDINGVNKGKNQVAKDIFGFALYNDGSLRPIGGANWDGKNDEKTKIWQDTCANDSQKKDISCTASIIEQGYKIKYKY